MKKIKYTNTGVAPLCVIKTSDKGHRITDESSNGILVIHMLRVRNRSKNESAKCRVYMDGKQYIFYSSKESLLAEISNDYLFWMLKFNNANLFLKFFENYNPPHFMLFDYVSKCVINKLIKDGVIK